MAKFLVTPAPPELSGATTISSAPSPPSPTLALALVVPVLGGVFVSSTSGAAPE
jgi:hypothetical protein